MANRSPANSAGTARCVAIDLGPRNVYVVEVEQSGGETRIVRRGSAALPPNCWTEVGANREGMASSIREALSSAGITAKSVVASLPRRLVTVRFARLPQAPPEQIRGMIEFEAQQYILFPLNEVILDYHVPTGIGTGISSGQDDLQTVLLVAARRSLIADIVSVFDRVGVELTQLSVSALALAEHVRDSLEPTAVIALESGSMDVSVVADGQLLFTRSSALEVAGIAREVAARRFSEEVARSFTAYQNEFRQKPLAHVYLCGSETATPDGDWMDQALIEALEKPVARLHNRLLPTGDPDARSYAIASGMALQTLGGALSDINLVPNERAEKRLQVQRTRRRQLLGLAAVAAVGAGVFYVNSAIGSQDVRRKETEAANKAMEQALKDEKPVQRSHDRVTALDRVLTMVLDRDHPSVDVLVALNRCLPKSPDIWLTQLNFDRGGLMTVRGDSKNSRSVTDLMINLQSSGAFSDVRLSYLADAQDTATPDVVQATAPTPPVTPLPGLQPAPTPTVPVSVPGSLVPGAPGTVMGTPTAVTGAPGAAPAMGGGTFNPGAAGFNPGAAGFNPGSYRGGFNGGGFNGGRFNRGNFGNPGVAPNGGYPGGAPGAVPGAPGAVPGAGGGAFNPGRFQNGSVPVQFTPGGVPGQVPGTVPAPSGAPSVPGAVAPGAPQFPQPGASGAPGGGRVVITPDMGMGGGGAAFNPRGGAGWRNFRNGVTGGPAPSSVNMPGVVPGAVGQPAPAAVAASPAKRIGAIKKPEAKPKPTLTGFVITCRLKPNAKLIPPTVQDAARNKPAPARKKTEAPETVVQGETDNTDDTGDEQ